MPRQRRGAAAPARSAPSRPTIAPARPNVTSQPPNRPSSTAAYPPAATNQSLPPAQAQAQPRTPGLFGQMASTAAGVAVGSSIGHAIGGFFGGGSSSTPAETQQTNTSPANAQDNSYNDTWGRSCETDAKQFIGCLDENQGAIQKCEWYLEKLVRNHLYPFGYDKQLIKGLFRKRVRRLPANTRQSCSSASLAWHSDRVHHELLYGTD
ncbi:MAG: hypothetical protein M1840_004120 [Geoglossum simile]|nr:MAG: hypothetical protein M1840_004120 [Geoglossum simile]